MTDNIHTQREWFEISEVEFSFLYPNEIRKLSVCEIDNPNVYDKNTKLPNKNGLYDPKLGVAPNDRDAVCQTCGHVGLQCSGHPGHIDLILPTYNPLIIDTLMRILKMNCFDCHRFRIKPKIKEDYRIILLLLRKDRIKQAYDFYEINSDEEKKRLQKLEKQPESQRQKQDHKERVAACKRKIETVEKIKSEYREIAEKSQDSISESTSTSIQLFTEFTKFFNGLCQNKCPYCKKENKIVKKEGASKIFVITRQSERKKELENSKTRKKSRDSISRGESTMYHTDANETNKNNRQKYMNPRQIYNQLKQLWRNQSPLLSIIFGNEIISNNYQMFFVKTVFVPPSRFRPQSKLGDQKYLHDHTNMMEKILKNNLELKTLMIQDYLEEICAKQGEKGKKKKESELKAIKNYEFTQTSWFTRVLKKFKHKNDFINKWLELQDSINCFIDAAKSSKQADKDSKGLRQILERKQGLFRMKMMGKRVNYAARSVISPDPSLNTNQVGVPIFMAKKLTFPESINEYNLQKLQSYVINGAKYPGANFLQQNGKIIKLDCLTEQQRVSHARNLWNNHENKVLYRHIQSGDNVLFNRQPTLHKAGLMTHKVKVLPKESTLRMNYANCKSYNADFDGDEMNMHALQTYMAKAEAELTVSDEMYASPTNGKPLRQIIQDAIIAAVYMTFKDTFFEKRDFCQLVYQSTFSLLDNRPANTRLFLVKPAIEKPKQLWTGKQLVTNVIKLVVEYSDLRFKDSLGLCMKASTKISKAYMQGYEDESQVLIWNNELLKGLIDKNQVGSGSDFGLLHSFNQLYGEKTTGKLMTCLNKLFLNYMQMHGFTCGLEDLLLKKKSNKQRREAIIEAHEYTVSKVCEQYGASHPEHVNYFGRSQYKCDEKGNYLNENDKIHLNKQEEIVKFLQHKFTTDIHAGQQLDAEYKHHLHEKSSTVIEDCLKGFVKKFPHNNFSMMTVTGAKGSNVNHSQVSVMLGQQELQGRRVPMMITGKTLPSFIAYDPNPRASGFISDRFLTGLRYQEFFFHCMAGREGLIDTAVKTSRSGYLQRCLMKHLESLKVEYDHTVRDCDGSIVQFLYGQDALNPTKQKFFNKMEFLTKNVTLLKQKFKYNEFKNDLKWKQIDEFKKSKQGKSKTIMERFPPGQNLGSISQKCYNLLKSNKTSQQFNEIYALKYKYNMIEAGEAVGCTAAQSIGQPSTQMTLNTFHLAGHGGVNLTLGIPRLRELLMTSSDKIKTPIMELSFKQKTTKQQALNHAKIMNRVKLSQLIKSIDVEEWKELFTMHKLLLSHQQRKRYYKIKIEYEKEEFIKKQFDLTHGDIEKKIKDSVVTALLNYINRVKKKNELRAQIKRAAVSNIQKEQREDQIQDDEQVQEKQKDEKDKMLKQFIKNMKDQRDGHVQNQMMEEDKEKAYKSPEFDHLTFSESGCEIIIKVSLNLKKFLMTKVVEKILKDTVMKEIQGIKSAIVLERKGGIPYIQTEGVNFNILQKFSWIDKQSVTSNDIQAMARRYGIEAARNVLVKEIVTLFGAYGVSVDYRHLYLIGDYVTFGGNIKAMNRNWMKYNASPFLRMTFQTSVKFITDAALRCETDKCKTPSSKIILGQPPIIGTGLCDLLMDSNL